MVRTICFKEMIEARALLPRNGHTECAGLQRRSSKRAAYYGIAEVVVCAMNSQVTIHGNPSRAIAGRILVASFLRAYLTSCPHVHRLGPLREHLGV